MGQPGAKEPAHTWAQEGRCFPERVHGPQDELARPAWLAPCNQSEWLLTRVPQQAGGLAGTVGLERETGFAKERSLQNLEKGVEWGQAEVFPLPGTHTAPGTRTDSPVQLGGQP